MGGVLVSAVLRVTGTLWAPIALHALGDYGRWLVAGDGQDHTTGTDAVVETIIIVLAAAVLVSVIREDARTRKGAQRA